MSDVSRKILVTSADSRKKTYNYANTASTDEQILGFAQGMYALSNNKVKQVTRVDKTKITNAEALNNG